MQIWLGDHEVASDQFALLFYGYQPARLASAGRVRALFMDAFACHLGKRLEVDVAKRGRYVSGCFRSPKGDVLLRADVHDTRLLLTCQAFEDEPHDLIQALESAAIRVDPQVVALCGYPEGGKSARQRYSPDGLLFSRVTHSEASSFQLIEVGEHPSFGRVLFLNGEAQIASSDEDHYSGQLIKGAIRKSTRRVLIMGGGDCGVLRQVLGHDQVEQAVMAEIDQAVIDASQRHFPEVVGSALADPRAEIVIGDAFRYVRDHGDFDLIVYDLSDTPLNLDGYGEVFPLINAALGKRGRVAVQCGSGMPQDKARLGEILRSMKQSFVGVKTREVVVPSFVHRPWVFGYGGKRA